MKREAHALVIEHAKRHGEGTAAAWCECRQWSAAQIPLVSEDTFRVAHAAHVQDVLEVEAEQERLAALWRPASREEARWITSEAAPVRGTVLPAAPRKSMRDAAFPVEYVHVDGLELVMPRGYSRAHVDAAREARSVSGEVLAVA